MSTQVTTAFVQEYVRGIDMLVQQADSRLRGAVRVETGVVGKQAFFDQIGAVNAIVRTGRHTDTPQIDTPHARRMVPMKDYEWADLLDEPDKVRVLNDPTNAYSQNAARAMLRAMDDEIIAAASANAFTGETGTTSTPLPAGQKVGVGSGTGMTVAKIQQAARILKENENDPDEPWYLVVAAQQEEDLLNDATSTSSTNLVTSRDFVADQPLVTGSIQRFMGFNFIRSQRLASIAGPDRICLAFRQSAITLAIARDSMGDIGPRRDKSMSMQVFYRMTLGSTRMEEEGVVEIHCRET